MQEQTLQNNKHYGWTTRIVGKKQVKDLMKQFRGQGYTVVNDGIGYIVSDITGEVLRALPNAVGSNYLVRYEVGLLNV